MIERHIPSPEGVLSVCREVAGLCYSSRPPSKGYAEQVAALLFGTAAQESHFIWRRQLGFSLDTIRGAWGLWQCERGSIDDSIRYLHRSPAMRAKVVVWLAQHSCMLDEFEWTTPLNRMRALAQNDYLACVFARLHYLRVPAPIPTGIDAHALYWKLHYNTHMGKGKPEEYLRNWNRYCAQYV